MTEVKEQVIRMEELLDKTLTPNTKRDKSSEDLEEFEKIKEIVRGKPKSGRIWKEQKSRFSSIIKTKGIRLSFEGKRKLREDLKRNKEMSRTIIANKKAEKEAKKERRIANLKRAEENRRKNEVVQVIKNTAKIKRMKKKQLRMIEKRDTNNM